MAEIESLDVALLASLATDPLLSDTELPLRGTYYPRGFAVEISTNSPEVIAAAHESWGQFQRAFNEPPVKLRIGVTGSGGGTCPPMPKCRAWHNLLISIADAENYVVCDLRRGIAFAWLTQSTIENASYLRYNFLEAAGLVLITQKYLVPLHAGCVRLHNRGVLLCGDAGAGKSSLAYACARRGWTFVSDDASCLIRDRKDLTVVGNPHQIRFREAGVHLFPELSRQPATLRGTGEFAIELATANVPGISIALTSSADYIVFLNRRDPDRPCLIPFPKENAIPWFEQAICYGEKEVREAQLASLHNLLSRPLSELRYRDLHWAVDRLETLVREGI